MSSTLSFHKLKGEDQERRKWNKSDIRLKKKKIMQKEMMNEMNYSIEHFPPGQMSSQSPDPSLGM